MVKGMSRQVIVVDSPDSSLFEQAIFIIRKDAANRDGITQERLIGEARRVAQGYCRSRGIKMRPKLKTVWIWSSVGAGGMALGWIFRSLL